MIVFGVKMVMFKIFHILEDRLDEMVILTMVSQEATTWRLCFVIQTSQMQVRHTASSSYLCYLIFQFSSILWIQIHTFILEFPTKCTPNRIFVPHITHPSIVSNPLWNCEFRSHKNEKPFDAVVEMPVRPVQTPNNVAKVNEQREDKEK